MDHSVMQYQYLIISEYMWGACVSLVLHRISSSFSELLMQSSDDMSGHCTEEWTLLGGFT